MRLFVFILLLNSVCLTKISAQVLSTDPYKVSIPWYTLVVSEKSVKEEKIFKVEECRAKWRSDSTVKVKEVLKETVFNDAGLPKSFNYTYSPEFRKIYELLAKLRLSSRDEEYYNIRFDYDQLNRLLSIDYVHDNIYSIEKQIIQNQYDTLDRLINQVQLNTYSDREKTGYSFETNDTSNYIFNYIKDTDTIWYVEEAYSSIDKFKPVYVRKKLGEYIRLVNVLKLRDYYKRDSVGRIIEKTDYATTNCGFFMNGHPKSDFDIITSYEFDNDQLISEKVNKRSGDFISVMKYYYADGRLIRTEEENKVGEKLLVYYEYNSLGLVEKIFSPGHKYFTYYRYSYFTD